MTQPFIKRINDTSNLQELDELKSKLHDKLSKKRHLQKSLQSAEVDRSQLQLEYQKLEQDKTMFDGEIRKLHTYLDPTGLTME